MTLRLAVRGTGELTMPRINALSGTTVAGGLGSEARSRMIALHGEDDVSVTSTTRVTTCAASTGRRRPAPVISWCARRTAPRPAASCSCSTTGPPSAAPGGTASFVGGHGRRIHRQRGHGSSTNTFSRWAARSPGHGAAPAGRGLDRPVQFVLTMALAADAPAAPCIAVVTWPGATPNARVRVHRSPGMALVLPVSDSDDPIAAPPPRPGCVTRLERGGHHPWHLARRRLGGRGGLPRAAGRPEMRGRR